MSPGRYILFPNNMLLWADFLISTYRETRRLHKPDPEADKTNFKLKLSLSFSSYKTTIKACPVS